MKMKADQKKKKKEEESILARWFENKEEQEKKKVEIEVEKKATIEEDLSNQTPKEQEKKTIEDLLAPQRKDPRIEEKQVVEKEEEKAIQPPEATISLSPEKTSDLPSIKEVEKETIPPILPKEISKEEKAPLKPSVVSDVEPAISKESTPKKEEAKEEIQKEQFLEKKIIHEFERILKDSRFEMNQLIMEYHLLENDSEQLYEVTDAEEMAEEIDRLLTRLKKVKEQFEVFENSINFDQIFQLEDHYFTEIIEKYKETVKQDYLIEEQVQDFKKSNDYVSIVQKIIEFELEEEKLEQKIQAQKEKLEIRDDVLEEMKENYFVLDEFSDQMESIQKEEEQMLYKIEQHLKESVDVTTRLEEQVHFSNHILVRQLLMIALLHKAPTLQAAGLAAVTGKIAIDQMRNLLFPKPSTGKVVTTYHYTDYHSEIKNTVHDVTKVTSSLKDGIDQIQELKKDFEKEFKEYLNVLPEFKALLENMEKVEESLLEKQEDIQKIEKKLETSLAINDQKVYYYEKQNQSNS